jgi:maleylpyruvate isomerase
MAFNAREQLANVSVIANETARMVQAFQSWPQSYWSRPTYCPGWTAADAVAHLATGGDFYAQVITSGRSGEPKFPWGAHSPAEVREARQVAVKALLDGGPPALLAGFEQAGAKLQAVLESLQEADLTKVALHPRGQIPIGLWIGMRILELSAHDWDIRQPHETQAHLSPTAVPALLSAMPELQVQLLGARLTEGLDGVYALRAGDAAWGFTIQGKTVTPLAQVPAPGACDTSLSTDAESMILLTVGRADVAEKLQSAALTITGNVEQGKQLCATLFRAY